VHVKKDIAQTGASKTVR